MKETINDIDRMMAEWDKKEQEYIRIIRDLRLKAGQKVCSIESCPNEGMKRRSLGFGGRSGIYCDRCWDIRQKCYHDAVSEPKRDDNGGNNDK